MAKILVVDDNAALLESLASALRAVGHVVTATNNGADALCLMHESQDFDLLLLDLGLPGMDGHEVLKRLGATSMPVIVETGTPSAALALDIARVKRVLMKPFCAQQLLAAVAEVLGGAK